MNQTLYWGIIGTGKIAGTFADSLRKSKTGKLIAVASRTQDAADLFGEKWDVPRRYSSYEQLLVDKDVQVVYIAIPHSMHAEWAIKAAEAKKHILCEKPIGLNYEEAVAVVEAVQKNSVFLLEAFMYRFHPQMVRLRTLIHEGAIGKIQMIQAVFSINAHRDPASRLLNNQLGGGGILDVGCYCTSFARLVAGAALGKEFVEPTKVVAVGHIGSTNVDEYALAALEFPEGIMAQLTCSIQMNAGISASIYGSEGLIYMPSPFTPIKEGKHMAFVVRRNGEKEAKTIFVETDVGLYTLEADTISDHLEKLQAPEMTWKDTLGNMNTLDKWRAAIGLVYRTDLA